MAKNLKDKLTGDRKITILFLVLAIINVALYVELYTYIITIQNQISAAVLNDFITINSAFIILGFISTRLTKLKQSSDGSLYEIGYLIIMGLMSLTITYFNKSTNGESLWAPFIEMFKILSVLLILTYLATKSRSFKAIMMGDRSRKTIIGQIIICSILAILASYLTMNLNGIPANARGLVVMISALLGGPYVGIPVGLISGLWRLSMGGPTALPCFAATVIAGIVGSLIYRWNGGEFLRPLKAGLLMFLYSGFEMYLIILMVSRPEGALIANTTYAPMAFAAVIGMLLFTLFLDEKKEKLQPDDDAAKISDTDRIDKLSQELEAYKSKADESERKMKEYEDMLEDLKGEVDELKKAMKSDEQ